jgi:hypothetical protein
MSAYNPYASGHTQQGDSMQQIDMPTNGQIMAGHSLDDIVSRNATLMRRQSMPQGFHPGQQQQQQQQQQSQQSQQSQPMDTDDPRRMSMMEFTGTSPTGPLESYQFSIPNSEMVDATAYMAASQANPAMLSRQSSAGGPDMAIDNGFAPPTSFMPLKHGHGSQQPLHQHPHAHVIYRVQQPKHRPSSTHVQPQLLPWNDDVSSPYLCPQPPVCPIVGR